MTYKKPTYPDYFLDRVELHEGFRPKAYKDTKGIWTVGIGHNLEDNKISRAAAKFILVEDLVKEERLLKKLCPPYRDVWGPRRYALLDMAFNMGARRLSGFTNMWLAVARGDWNSAADEALDSKWRRKDVPEWRSDYIASILRTGEVPES